jgi:hypothetical protein
MAWRPDPSAGKGTIPSGRGQNARRLASHSRVVLFLISSLLGPAATAQSKPDLPDTARAVLDRFAGTWDVTVTVKKPQPAVVTYKLTSAWVLDQHFLRSESGVKSDGSQEFSMFTYDPASRQYPLMIFYSSGVVAYLQHGEWDGSSSTITWKSGVADPIQFQVRCSFEGAMLRCSTQVSGGLGATGIDLDSVARRR